MVKTTYNISSVELLTDIKSVLIRRVASLDGENLVVFYYFNADEIWADKRSEIWGLLYKLEFNL
jgi:hypothetical protein